MFAAFKQHIMAQQQKVELDPGTENMVCEYIKKGGPNDQRSLARNLTQERWNKLKGKRSECGGTLWDCVKSGVLCPDSKMGAYLCDASSVDVFEDLFESMILGYFNTNQYHPESNFGDLESPEIKELLDLKRLDNDEKNPLIVSTRVRVARNLEGYPYAASLTKAQRDEIEKKIADGTKGFTGDLAGEYNTLATYSEEKQKEMVENHIMFHNRDEYIRKAGMYDDWPSGRGVFYNKDGNFMIWVNEEDHMRVISLQKGNDLLGCYGRLVRAVNALNELMPLAKHKKWGMMSSCPTNLGTGLRASVHIKIPKVSELKCFNALCKDMGIDIRGIHGEHSESADGTYDISNKRRFGKSEIDCLGEMARGVKNLIRIEKALNGDKDCC